LTNVANFGQNNIVAEKKSVKQIIVQSVLNFLKGILVGATIIIPGFSSGTVMILCRIYEPLLDNVSGLFKSKKGAVQGLIFLTPIALGAILGVVLVAQLFSWLIERFSLPVFALFAGFILGSIPMIVREVYFSKGCCRAQGVGRREGLSLLNDSGSKLEMATQQTGTVPSKSTNNINHTISSSTFKGDCPLCDTVCICQTTNNQNIQAPNKSTIRHWREFRAKFSPWHLEPIIIAAILVIGLAILQRFVIQVPTAGASGLTIISGFMIVLSGILGAAALIIPGLSGALMLILLGQYGTIMEAISMSSFNFIVIALFILGLFVGFILSVKLVRFLLKRYRDICHLAIVGFLIGSIAGIFMLAETYYSATNAIGITVAALLFIGGTVCSYFLGRIGERKK